MANVVRVNNATVRNLVEQFTLQFTFPDIIRFIQDANSLWVTSTENKQNFKYAGVRQDLKTFLNANGVVTEITSLKEALDTYGAVITYVPAPETEALGSMEK